MRRRKARVVWLPVDLENRLGKAPVIADNANLDSSHIIHIFTMPPLGDPALTEEIPIVQDGQGSGLGLGLTLQDKSLADIEQSGYRLRRIVGKLFFGMAQDDQADPTDVAAGVVTAGFIVRRVGPAGTSLAQQSSGATGELISTATLNNISDPWIWRRSWLLANTKAPGLSDGTTFPITTNIQYGSALDGPHVDQKTARIVGPEERLFLSVTCQGIDGNSQSNPAAIILVGDLRVLASMRSSVGNRRNANR